MQIVIDIPEEMYKHTQEYESGGFNQENDGKLFMAIKNGTPLPKGHGRLIDADALFDEYSEVSLPAYIIEPYINAPIIIEADKEVDE